VGHHLEGGRKGAAGRRKRKAGRTESRADETCVRAGIHDDTWH